MSGLLGSMFIVCTHKSVFPLLSVTTNVLVITPTLQLFKFGITTSSTSSPTKQLSSMVANPKTVIGASGSYSKQFKTESGGHTIDGGMVSKTVTSAKH